MATLTPFELGDAGLQYVSACCRDGNSLSKSLLDLVEIGKGRVRTLLPSDVPKVNTTTFQYGGLTKANDSTDWLVGIIQDFLAHGPDRVVVLEDLMSRKGDPIFDKAPYRLFFRGDEVYCYLLPADHSDQVRLALTDCGGNYSFVGVMTTVSEDHLALLSQRDVATDLLKELAQQTQEIVVGAYDGEGYLIWTKDAAAPIRE